MCIKFLQFRLQITTSVLTFLRGYTKLKELNGGNSLNQIIYKNAKLILPYRIVPNGWISVENGKIADMGEGDAPAGAKAVDLGGKYLAPGFIELHTHGCGGHDYMDGTAEAFLGGAREMASHGVTCYYPTMTTGAKEDFDRSIAAYNDADARNTEGAAFAGIHMEGPYFSFAMKGAQDPRYLKNPDPAEYLPMLEAAPQIKRWSAAPELPGGIEFGRELSRRGIVAAMGHTDGIYDDLMKAFENGYSLMCHFYSGMSSIRRINAFRYSGGVELGYLVDDLYIEIIADGVHLPESILRQIFKMKSHDKICLITDSIRGAGMPEGTVCKIGNKTGGMDVVVEDGVAKLMDRSAFAGSVATMERLIRTVMSKADLSLVEAVKMVTYNPASAMKINDRKGLLCIGYDADFAIFDDKIEIAATVIGGRTVYSK